MHGGIGYLGQGEYNLTIEFGKCLPHSAPENGNSRSNPPPPRNLRAVQEKGTVQLAWDPPDDAEVTGYRIERRPTSGDQSDQQRSDEPRTDGHPLVEDTGSADTGYTDRNLETGVEYQYRVSSRNEDGQGEASEWVTAGPRDDDTGEATDRPHGLSAVAGNGQVTLTWNAPDDANAVLDHRILRHQPEEGEPEPLVYVDYTGSRATAYTDTRVQPGVLYIYRVQAADLFGFLGEASEPASVRMPESYANLPASGSPTISGTAQVGETLTADTSGIADEDGLDNAAFSYQWLADDADIPGAAESTYTILEADEGKTVTVQVSFTDDAGNEESLTSAATEAVAGNEESLTSEDVAVWSAIMTVESVYQGYGYYSTDTKKAGSLSPASFEVDGTTYTVKMVETQGWMYIGVDRELPFDFVLELDGERFASSDASFRSYSYGNIYRWERTGLRWRDGDTVEVRLLRAFEEETAVNSPATGAPTVSGAAQVGETLTAGTSGIADEDGLENVSFNYQWLADDAEIAGATGYTYTLADTDAGKTIKVRVSFTDDADNEETLTSAQQR